MPVLGRVSGPSAGGVFVAPRTDLPAARGRLAGLVEDTAIRAGKGHRLGATEPAALGSFPLADGLHDVMPAVLVDAHPRNDRAKVLRSPRVRPQR